MAQQLPRLTSGTPAQRWQSFREEAQVKSSPGNKISESKIQEIKELIDTINPETGYEYSNTELSMKVGVCKRIISMARIHKRLHEN